MDDGFERDVSALIGVEWDREAEWARDQEVIRENLAAKAELERRQAEKMVENAIAAKQTLQSELTEQVREKVRIQEAATYAITELQNQEVPTRLSEAQVVSRLEHEADAVHGAVVGQMKQEFSEAMVHESANNEAQFETKLRMIMEIANQKHQQALDQITRDREVANQRMALEATEKVRQVEVLAARQEEEHRAREARLNLALEQRDGQTGLDSLHLTAELQRLFKNMAQVEAKAD